MQILYLDESGCTGELPSATSSVQPVFVLAGVVLSQEGIRQLTLDYLRLKLRFFPRLSPPVHFLDSVLLEIKGADLRRSVSRGNRDARRHALLFLGSVIKLLEDNRANILGKILVKGLGRPINSTSLYTASVQSICDSFQHILHGKNETGLVIADHRNEPKNAKVSHSIFTKKFSQKGDSYPHLLEMPVYGHSQNQVGLQLADLVCSSLLFPMAAYSFCTGFVTNVHVQPGFAIIRERFGDRIKSMLYRYTGTGGRTLGGIVVDDSHANKPGLHLFGGTVGAVRLPTSTLIAPPLLPLRPGP